MNWQVANRRDVDFLLFELLQADKLLERPYYALHDQQTLSGALDLAFDISTEVLWPNSRSAEINEPVLKNGQVRISDEIRNSVMAIRDGGFIAASFDEKQGGMQLPLSITQACLGVIKGADAACSAYITLTRAAANLLNAHGSAEQKRLYMEPMLEGRFFGTMCLSEPDVGSSLGDLNTSASPSPDGSYRIHGSKMWISGGDQDMSENIIHLVLAKLPDAPLGAHGLSLFIVPKTLVNDDGSLGMGNDVVVSGLNHKMGYRAASNCALNFGENNACTGYLIGKAHQGLSYMFHMMNEARISVGTGAAMLGYAGYGQALAYAKERVQGRRSIDGPQASQVAIINHPDVKRMLLQQKCYVEGALALCLYGAMLLDRELTSSNPDEAERHKQILDVLTPIIKSWPSEYGLEANKLSIQVHGGYGYARDFLPEKLYRDNRLNPIHEGTTGIQALDFLGRKVRMKKGKPFRFLLDEIECEINHCLKIDGLKAHSKTLATNLEKVTSAIQKTQILDGDEKITHATQIFLAFGHVVIAWLWLWQTRIAQSALANEPAGTETNFYRGKIAATDFFFGHELPNVQALLAPAQNDDFVCISVEEAIL